MRLPTVEPGNPAAQELYDSTLSRLTDPIDADFVRRFRQSTLARPVPARVWKATLEGLLEDDSTAELHQINGPTLIVWGDHDASLPAGDRGRKGDHPCQSPRGTSRC